MLILNVAFMLILSDREHLVQLRSLVFSAPGHQVLDWRFAAVLA